MSAASLRRARIALLPLATLLALALTAQIFPPADPSRHEQILFNGQVQVGPGRQFLQQFSTRSNFRNARIAGSIQASGGSGNDIRILVLKGNSVVFDSGQRRSVVISVDFSQPGQYTLVFDNAFSLLSPKIVAGRISLVHWGVDQDRNAAAAQQFQQRFQLSTRTLARLYSTLRANERIWATTQVPAQPRVTLIDNPTVNAFANSAENFIGVNRGFFSVVDRAGPQGEAVLAAVLAHELGHIFYRHPGYGTGSGIKGLFDELRGVSTLDRNQEREADFFGVQLACQAGFDPTGVLVLMRTFAEMDQGSGSFMRTHPTGIERYNSMQAYVAECRASQNPDTQAPSPVSAATSSAAAVAPAVQPPAPPADPASDWKIVGQPGSRWRFKIAPTYLYGEAILPDQRRQGGDFDTLDVKKKGDLYLGTQFVKVNFNDPASPPQSPRTKNCQWRFAVEITAVSDDRIEGRWEGYPTNTRPNPATCEWPVPRIWEDVTWIRF